MNEIVYISYTRSDSKLAKKLADDLRSRNVDVWLDINEIREGSNIASEVLKGLEKCTSMIAILNETSFNSNYIRNELEYAIFNNKLQDKILPVFIRTRGNIEINKLPWILERIKHIYIDNTNSDETNSKTIINKYLKMIKESKAK